MVGRRFHVAMTLAVGVLTACAFALSWRYGRVNLDDYIYTLNHPEVTDGLSWHGFKWAFTWVGDAMWTPLTWLSYMADHSIGWGTCGMHVSAIVLQSFSAMMLFHLLVLLAGNRNGQSAWVALMAALFWSVHPLRVESVVWIASRKDMLSTVFFIAALLAWARSRWLVALVLVAVGGLAKSSVMLFPVYILLLDGIFLRRRKPYFAYGLAIALSVAFAFVGGWAQKFGGAMDPGVIPFWFKLLNAGAALTIYVGNTLCPTDLAVQCILRYPWMPRVSVVGFAALGAYGWWTYCLARRLWMEKRLPDMTPEIGAWVSILCYFVCLGPFLGIVSFGVHAFADRFTILPALTLSLAVILASRMLSLRKSHLALGLVCCLGLVVLSMRQTRFWANDGLLFARTVEIDGRRNIIAQYLVSLYHWETTHDMSKVYEHISAMFDAAGWAVKQIVEDGGYMLVESAFETGHEKEGERAFWCMKDWNDATVDEVHRRGNVAVRNTDSFLYAEAIRTIYSEPNLKHARRLLAEIRKHYPNSIMTREIEYLMAQREGDAAAVAAARSACAAATGDSYRKNTWARDKTAE